PKGGNPPVLPLLGGGAGRQPGRDVFAQVILGLGQDQAGLPPPEPGPQLAEVLLDRLARPSPRGPARARPPPPPCPPAPPAPPRPACTRGATRRHSEVPSASAAAPLVVSAYTRRGRPSAAVHE